MLLSGPAGGLAAARKIGKPIGSDRLLTFDMGGTSADVALIDQGIQLTNEGRIGHDPVTVPMVDQFTWIDQGGLLQLGPKSVGACWLWQGRFTAYRNRRQCRAWPAAPRRLSWWQYAAQY